MRLLAVSNVRLHRGPARMANGEALSPRYMRLPRGKRKLLLKLVVAVSYCDPSLPSHRPQKPRLAPAFNSSTHNPTDFTLTQLSSWHPSPIQPSSSPSSPPSPPSSPQQARSTSPAPSTAPASVKPAPRASVCPQKTALTTAATSSPTPALTTSKT